MLWALVRNKGVYHHESVQRNRNPVVERRPTLPASSPAYFLSLSSASNACRCSQRNRGKDRQLRLAATTATKTPALIHYMWIFPVRGVRNSVSGNFTAAVASDCPSSTCTATVSSKFTPHVRVLTEGHV